MTDLSELKIYLDNLVDTFQAASFIEKDPIAIPHGFEAPRDQEIIGLFSALLAWGQRTTTLRKMEDLCERMHYRPHQFVYDFNIEKDAYKLASFKHRTFQPEDAIWMVNNLSMILREYGSLENAFCHYTGGKTKDLGKSIGAFSDMIQFIHPGTPPRLRKHLATPSTGSACKRLCMYLRWMSRQGPVDLGIWKCVSPSNLVLPLDIHSGRQARALGMLHRASNDWKAALELTRSCKLLCPEDPCKYDYAFFGAGVNGISLDEKFTGTLKLNVSMLANKTR